MSSPTWIVPPCIASYWVMNCSACMHSLRFSPHSNYTLRCYAHNLTACTLWSAYCDRWPDLWHCGVLIRSLVTYICFVRRLRRSATIADYKRAAEYAICSCSISAQSAMVRPGTLYIAAAIVAVLITRGRTCVTSTLLPILFHKCQNSTQVVCNLWLILEDGIISREARLSAWVIVPQAKNRFKLPEVRGPHLSPAQTGYFFWCDFGK